MDDQGIQFGSQVQSEKIPTGGLNGKKQGSDQAEHQLVIPRWRYPCKQHRHAHAKQQRKSETYKSQHGYDHG